MLFLDGSHFASASLDHCGLLATKECVTAWSIITCDPPGDFGLDSTGDMNANFEMSKPYPEREREKRRYISTYNEHAYTHTHTYANTLTVNSTRLDHEDVAM